MIRHASISLIAAALALPPGVVSAQADADAAIRNAMTAAPPAIAEKATVMDGSGRVLRQGTNGWVCMPDDPAVPNNSPMCLDQPWLAFIEALMKKHIPKIEALGVGYMLQGDMPVSNVDPFAAGPTATNQWIANSGPHIMLVVPNPAMLDNLPTDPASGGPWVMWKGTPYAHVMIPTVPRR